MSHNKLNPQARERITLRFSGTYHFVYLLDSFVSRSSILTRSFSDHFDEGLEFYILPFKRWTSLHVYIEFFIREVLSEDFDRASALNYRRRAECEGKFYCPAFSAYLLATDMLRSHDLDSEHLVDELDGWVEVGSCHCTSRGNLDSNLDGPDFDQIWENLILGEDYAQLVENLTEEVFFVLFANRTFLYKFHSHLAQWVRGSTPWDWVLDAEKLFRSDREGVLKRVAIPDWAKRAIFFRDRGRCCNCERDLGGTYSPLNRAEYDHIVPLSLSGLNDVSNLQLLCKDCNSSKSGVAKSPSQVYDRWFPVQKNYLARQVPTLESIVLGLAIHDEDGP